MRKLTCLLLLAVVPLFSACVTTQPQQDDGIQLVQSRRGAAIAIQDRLLFDVGASALRPESDKVMDRVAELLTKSMPDKQVLVEGHTDNSGSEELNQRLSDNRALSVKAALEKRGVAAARMTTKGYGFSEPADSNATPEGRQHNRRAEIVFPGMKLDELKKNTEGKFNFGSAFKKVLNAL